MMRTMLVAALVAAALLLAGEAGAQDEPMGSRSFERLEGECASGSSASCEELYYRHEFGRNVPKDPAKAAHYKLRTCEAGDARACGVYASKVYMSKPGYPARDAAVVAKYAYQGCVGGDKVTCGFASSLANKTTSYTATQRKQIYDNVCREGDAYDCEMAAFAEGKRSNWQSAAAYARIACSKGQSTACHNANAWQVRHDNAQRSAASQPRQAARSGGPKTSTEMYRPTTSEDMYQKSTGRRSNSTDSNARSGYVSCTKANGASGQQYWYYGFDNRRKYGPCF